MNPTPYQAELARAHQDRLNRLWPVPVRVPQKPVDIGHKRIKPCPPLPPPLWLVNLKPNQLKSIIALCARYFDLTMIELKSERRTQAIMRQRQITMYIAKIHTGKSLPEIGRRLDRDHTTVLHGVRRIEALMRTDWLVAYDVAMIERDLGQ